MWFATEQGVVKYNGYSFTQFNTSTGLPSDDIWQLYRDNSDRIWLYGFNYEFGYIKNNKYRALPVKSEERIFYASYLAEKGGLLYFLAGIRLEKFVVVSGEVVKEFTITDENKFLGKNEDILRFGQNFDYYYRDRNNNVYSQSLVPDGSKKRHISTLPDSDRMIKAKQNFSPVNKIYQFKFNGEDIRLLDLDNGTSKKLTLKEMGAENDEKIYVFNPYYSQSNVSTESILATAKAMYVIDSNLNFVSRKPIADVLPSKSQFAYRIIDDMGIAWFGTNGDGVWVRTATHPLYRKEKELEFLRDKKYLGEIDTRSYWGDDKERLVYEVEKNRVVNKIQFDDNVFFKNATGNDSVIYIASIANLFKYDRMTKSMSVVRPADKIDPGGMSKAILTYGTAMFTGMNKALLVNDRLYTIASDYTLMNRLAKDSIISTVLSDDRFNDMYIDPTFERAIFFNKERVAVINTRTNEKVSFDRSALKNIGIRNVKQIERDDFGNWYILDDEKLTVLNSSLKGIQQLNFNVNLRGALLKIVDNKIIVAGNFGVGYSVVSKSFTFSSFKIVPNYSIGRSNYHQVENFSMTTDGYGLMKTEAGIFSFTIAQLEKQARHNTSTNDLFHIIVKAPEEMTLSMNDTLAVSQEEGNLVLDAINYYGKGELTYRYYIASNGKQVSSSSGEIYLELLEPGKYHEVLCSVKDGLYESPVYRFYIYRYPMWWQTDTWKTIFWVSGVILFLGLVFLIVFVTRYFVRKKNERRRALTDLELQAIHSQINPHFIFNTLSAALFYISKKRLDDAYTHVNKFSQLLRAYLKSSHDRYVILEEEIKMLRNYIELQQIRFEEKFEYKVEIDNKLPIGNIRIPSLLLQPLVENSINHGLFHREGGGVLLLKFEQGADSTELVCTIEDNGVGRDAARKINESASNKESHGTRLTHQLLDVFRQYESLDIKLSYTDKQFPDTGTIVILTLKNIRYVA